MKSAIMNISIAWFFISFFSLILAVRILDGKTMSTFYFFDDILCWICVFLGGGGLVMSILSFIWSVL
jgi:hypothetical protein